MDTRYYKFTKVETLDIDVDEYVEDIVAMITDRVCEDYDIWSEENRKNIDSLISDLMKDITKKLVKKYIDKT